VITPGDLLELAVRLTGQSDEASQRCAASRAYFAAFSHLAAEAATTGFRLTGSARDHLRLREALGAASELSDYLEQLRKLRNQADYDLASDFPERLAEHACAAATEILSRHLSS
jgi:hypothetical protein